MMITKIGAEPDRDYPMHETPEDKARRIGVPVIPPRKPVRPESNPTIGVCGACGIELKKIMHLSCQREDCPMNRQVFL